MKTAFSTTMRQATQLMREQNVIEATRVIQRALSGRGHAPSRDEQSPESSRLVELQANVPESSGGFEQPRQDVENASAFLRDAPTERRPSARTKRPLGEVLTLLRQGGLPSFGLELGAICEIAQTTAGAGAGWGSLSRTKLRLRGWFEGL